MKIIAIISLCIMCATASAAVLKREVREGNKKVCIYSDGSAVTVSAVSLCPLTN